MTTAVPDTVPMRWRDYVLVRDAEVSSFWKAHLAEKRRSLLLIFGKGFDPRTCIALRTIADLAGSALTETLALEYEEGEAALSAPLRKKAATNWQEAEGILAGKGRTSVHKITFRTSDGRRVGARNAANIFTD